MKPFPTSLRSRLIALLLFSLGPAALATGYFSLQHEENAARHQRRDIANLAQLAVAKQETALQAAHSTLAVLAQTGVSGDIDRAQCLDVLTRLMRRHSEYVSILVVDIDGHVRCAAPSNRRIYVGDRKYFRQALVQRTFAVGEYTIGRLTGKPLIPVAYPAIDRHDAVAAVVVAGLDIAKLSVVLTGARLAQGTTTLALDRNGVVIAVEGDGMTVGDNIAATPLGRTVLQQHSGVVAIQGTANTPSRLYGFARSDDGSIYIAIGRTLSDVDADAHRIFWSNLAALIAVWLIMLLIVWIGAHYIAIKPIQILNRTAQSLARGEFSARSELAGPAVAGELAQLAQVFDGMAIALAQREADIRDTESRMTEILAIAVDAIVAVDEKQAVILFNRGAEVMFGYSAAEMIGEPLDKLIPTQFHARHPDLVARFSKGPDTARRMGERREVLGRRKDGSEFPADISISKSTHKGGAIMTAIVRDVTERKQAESSMMHMALHDALTGLPNRILFRDRLQHAMTEAARDNRLVALVFLDLDRFKVVNDSLGHGAGDMLLVGVAERLQGCMRRGDTVARLGGDEFTLVFADVAKIEDIDILIRKVLDTLASPFRIYENEVFVTASVGITVFPFDDSNVDALLKNADTAMYQAKEGGRNNYRFYDAAMNDQISGRVAFESRLRRALEREEFFLEYQPQIDARDGHIVGIEALLRWRDGDRVVPPDRFISIAEETGLIVPIGRWVLNRACEQANTWHMSTGKIFTMAVNISGRQFEQADFVGQIEQALASSGIDPKCLELEFTESILMADTQLSLTKLFALQSLGVRMALDDFGTGYSSLSYLKRFPINTLKIDRSFVADVPIDADDMAIVATICALGQNLNLNLVAEGVETAEQATFLQTSGCHLMQGYYYSRPVTADKVSTLLNAATKRDKASWDKE